MIASFLSRRELFLYSRKTRSNEALLRQRRRIPLFRRFMCSLRAGVEYARARMSASPDAHSLALADQFHPPPGDTCQSGQGSAVSHADSQQPPSHHHERPLLRHHTIVPVTGPKPVYSPLADSSTSSLEKSPLALHLRAYIPPRGYSASALVSFE